MFEIGNIVKQIASYWDGFPFIPSDDLYVISEISANEYGYSYGIRNMDIGSISYWWRDYQLELVDKGSIELAKSLRDKDLERRSVPTWIL